MNLDSCVPIKDQKESQNTLFEVISAEKQLWALIHSKGLLQTEVQELYHKARSSYEKIILNDQEEVELQDVEYSLWKLHYKHIDEFRKRIRQTSTNTDQGTDSHKERFELFLSEATEFYQDLIAKLRRRHGLGEDPFFNDKGGILCSVDPTKLGRCQYSCHRFLVCLGDLARYRQLCKKVDFERHDWSVAATNYFKATLVWPDSGNPHNQLALLATYIGDDLLALYHCIRSLSIKEPFPDAWNNLILLFEKNRSSQPNSLSREAHFNFSNPSERSTSLMESQQCGEHISSTKSDLWPLFVRMTSFFLVESSLEEFPCTFASTMRELDHLLALDDAKLKASLESYQHMDSARTGPYRSLQMVSVLIFIIDSLTESLHHKESKEKNEIMIQPALTATFIFLGRLVERCLKGNSNSMELSPLLPAVLVFVEWLVGTLNKLETYGAYEKGGSAISYFADAFVDLLNRLAKNSGESQHQENALWEDYELRGFVRVAHAHGSLDFTTNHKVWGFDVGKVYRAGRIFRAATKIVGRSDGSRELIFYDNLGRKFYTTESEKLEDQREAVVVESSSHLGVKESQKQKCGATNGNGKDTVAENEIHPFGNGNSLAIEEEEVILFNPITRYNSAPIYASITDDEMPMEDITKDQTSPSDESLRRATSLIDPLSNFRSNKQFKQQEPLLKETATYPAGPPSLSSWVLNRESSIIEKEKGTRDFFKPRLSPIEEAASASLSGLSISEMQKSLIDSDYVSPPPYSAPIPSAPVLPDDAIWFTDMKERNGILGAPPLSGYANLPTTHGPLSFGYQPVFGMSSSEWLYHYSNQNLNRAGSQAWPAHFYSHDGSRFEACDRWGNPLSPNTSMANLESPRLYSGYPLGYGAGEERRERLFCNFERPSPYGCGVGTELRADQQPPLLPYLKEKEWQLQQQSQGRGPVYMGN